jgi:pyridoxal phosphate enzyme (YggS family)
MNIQNNFTDILQKIREAEIEYHRIPNSIKLLVVTKGRSVNELIPLIEAGQTCFGESYLQEALPKISLLKNYNIEWHFIGPIQSNKTKAIAENFAWVESVDRLKIAQRLNSQRPPTLPPINVCIEIHIGDEATKSGVNPSDVAELATAIKNLPNLRLHGLMAIPPPTHSFDKQLANFQILTALFKQLNDEGLGLDTLSMGMSDDFTAAIAAGSTEIRIGSAIFNLSKSGDF